MVRWAKRAMTCRVTVASDTRAHGHAHAHTHTRTHFVSHLALTLARRPDGQTLRLTAAARCGAVRSEAKRCGRWVREELDAL